MTVDRNWKCNENVEDEQDDANKIRTRILKQSLSMIVLVLHHHCQ